jgi:hypothetical protein
MVGVFPYGFALLAIVPTLTLAGLSYDSAIGRIELENIVEDLVREKRLVLVKGTHALGLNSLFYIRFVYLDVRHIPHCTTSIHPRVPVSVLCIQSRFWC